MTPSVSLAFPAATLAAVLLASCTDARSASSSTSQTDRTHHAAASLRVHIGLFGGPPRSDGGSALSNAPQPNATVIVVNGTGRRWTSLTGRDGIATFTVPAGRYTVSSSFCGTPQLVTVQSGSTKYVQIACGVP